jgi:hypothetical protein
MAFANTNYSDILATTIERRTGKVRDNVTRNNALLAQLKRKGRIRPVSGGSLILEELSFAANGNGTYYSGYDLLSVAAQDVISAAQFSFKQIAVPVVISGLEQLQNSGPDAIIDLMEARIGVAEGTMANLISQGMYSDGTIYGGKAINGLDTAVPSTAKASQTDTYGGISRANFPFWRTQTTTGTTINTAATVQTTMNAQWATQIRGSDKPDIIIMDTVYWSNFMASVQNIQRITNPDSGDLGFPSLKFITADVVLDTTTIGAGPVPTIGTGGDSHGTAFFLNTKYLSYRPHKDRDMVPLSPNRRYSVNQDAEVQILAWAGNMTCSGAQFQGRSISSTP